MPSRNKKQKQHNRQSTPVLNKRGTRLLEEQRLLIQHNLRVGQSLLTEAFKTQQVNKFPKNVCPIDLTTNIRPFDNIDRRITVVNAIGIQQDTVCHIYRPGYSLGIWERGHRPISGKAHTSKIMGWLMSKHLKREPDFFDCDAPGYQEFVPRTVDFDRLYQPKREYDKGHINSADNQKYGQYFIEQAFFISNAIPQHRSNNRGSWSTMAMEAGHIYPMAEHTWTFIYYEYDLPKHMTPIELQQYPPHYYQNQTVAHADGTITQGRLIYYPRTLSMLIIALYKTNQYGSLCVRIPNTDQKVLRERWNLLDARSLINRQIILVQDLQQRLGYDIFDDDFIQKLNQYEGSDEVNMQTSAF